VEQISDIAELSFWRCDRKTVIFFFGILKYNVVTSTEQFIYVIDGTVRRSVTEPNGTLTQASL